MTNQRCLSLQIDVCDNRELLKWTERCVQPHEVVGARGKALLDSEVCLC